MQRRCQSSCFACVVQGLPSDARIPNLQITQLIPHAQLVVSLEFVPVARSADALKVFAAVWIAGIQTSDEPSWHDVVHIPPDSCLFEIHSACLNLTLPTQSWRPQTGPSFPQWRAPWPLPLHAAPAHWPLLGTEAGPAVEASPVA